MSPANYLNNNKEPFSGKRINNESFSNWQLGGSLASAGGNSSGFNPNKGPLG